MNYDQDEFLERLIDWFSDHGESMLYLGEDGIMSTETDRLIFPYQVLNEVGNLLNALSMDDGVDLIGRAILNVVGMMRGTRPTHGMPLFREPEYDYDELVLSVIDWLSDRLNEVVYLEEGKIMIDDEPILSPEMLERIKPLIGQLDKDRLTEIIGRATIDLIDARKDGAKLVIAPMLTSSAESNPSIQIFNNIWISFVMIDSRVKETAPLTIGNYDKGELLIKSIKDASLNLNVVGVDVETFLTQPSIDKEITKFAISANTVVFDIHYMIMDIGSLGSTALFNPAVMTNICLQGDILILLISSNVLTYVTIPEDNREEYDKFVSWIDTLDKTKWLSPLIWRYNMTTNFIEPINDEEDNDEFFFKL